ncbi:hypothetical protein [Roseomonas elaeocarpi]|uniref:Uncharacterized protein n=1 Tax=Roseomonas elaeocarpi TaxID=907779 RepID=A0ABV6JST5_9PROT
MSSSRHSSAFEEHLAILRKSPCSGDIEDALIAVADTGHACKLWFEAQRLAPTAADIMTMTRMVLDREQRAVDLRRRQEEADEAD